MDPVEAAKVTAVTLFELKAAVVAVGITILSDALPSLSVCKNCAMATAEGADVAALETPATSWGVTFPSVGIFFNVPNDTLPTLNVQVCPVSYVNSPNGPVVPRYV